MRFFPDAKRSQKDLEAMKKQAQSTNAEYDRLAEENRSLQASRFTFKLSDHVSVFTQREGAQGQTGTEIIMANLGILVRYRLWSERTFTQLKLPSNPVEIRPIGM